MSFAASSLTPTQRELWDNHVARRRRIHENRIELQPRKPARFRVIDLRPMRRMWLRDVKCQCCRPQPVRWPRTAGVPDIARIVAFEFCIGLDELYAKVRLKKFVDPRQVAMYLARIIPSSSGRQRTLPEIAAKMGRDHTTVLHGARTVADKIARAPDSEFAMKVERCRQKILEWANLPPNYGANSSLES